MVETNQRGDDTPPAGRRRGRPPATDSADTRRAILQAARTLFAERGYAAVTNKDVARATGITTGTLYHYVESKLDLYVEADRDMQRAMARRFPPAAAGADTFLGKIVAVMEVAHAMGVEDPTLAAFVGMVRMDCRRHPEVAERLVRSDAARDEFFADIVEAGVATGEFRVEDKPKMLALVRAIMIGLTEILGRSEEQHRCAVDAVTALFRGTIFTPVD